MMNFDELLKEDNIDYAVSRIAKDFRKKHRFPEVRQLGVVVADVENAAAELEERGIGPFFIASDTLDFWNERGKSNKFHGKVGIACHKDYEIELLEPGTGSTFYKSCVDKKGRMILQHLGFLVQDVDSRISDLEKSGCSTWVRGRIKSFSIVTNFAYMDTVERAGIILEFIDMRFLGFPVTVPGGIYHNLGKMEKLIGRRSLSF